MNLRYKKDRPLNREVPYLKDTKIIIVATEGEKREKWYFALFRRTRVQIVVLPTEEGESSPEHVFERLHEYVQDRPLEEDDELWIVIDVDRWGDKKLSTIAGYAHNKDYYLSISNPCFELWLLLHFRDINNSNQPDCHQLKQLLHSESFGINLESHYLEHVLEAIDRAENLDRNSGDRWPLQLGTHVYRVMRSFLDTPGQ